MDLRQLEIVRAVAEKGSSTAAAAPPHVSQPAISRQILQLEEDLGEPLFLRLGRKVRLTAAGTTLVDLSQRGLTDNRDTTTSIIEQHEHLAGTLHLGGAMPVSLHVFPPRLKDFR